MSGFRRYALYYLPEDEALAAFGASWLGWDIAAGRPAVQPPVEGLEAMTAEPRRYGFHGTLKPPFRLAEGRSAEDLARAVEDVASRSGAVRTGGLQLASLGRFLALVPTGETAALGDFAFRCVTELDAFRATPDDRELARRRAAGLSPRQDALLMDWGYPYVAEEFRFHLTLSGKLSPDQKSVACAALEDHLPDLPDPFEVRSVALVGEDGEGLFHLVHRYTLSG